MLYPNRPPNFVIEFEHETGAVSLRVIRELIPTIPVLQQRISFQLLMLIWYTFLFL
jgi:hypothetical protein